MASVQGERVHGSSGKGHRVPRAGHGNAEDRAGRGSGRAASDPLLWVGISSTQNTFSRHQDICLSYF